MAQLSARELCNLVFALLVPPPEKEVERDQWIEDLNDDGSAQAWAIRMALEHAARIAGNGSGGH